MASRPAESIPILETERLRLRFFQREDAPEVERLAGVFEIADTTLNIPYPYPEGGGVEWIDTHPETFDKDGSAHFAITLKDTGALVGAIGLMQKPPHNHAEMGYWVGVPYWNRGFCTEAAQEVLRYGFETLGLHRIYAVHFSRNPASGRVMQKIGMQHEGHLREHVMKWEKFEDLEYYGILRPEWMALQLEK